MGTKYRKGVTYRAKKGEKNRRAKPAAKKNRSVPSIRFTEGTGAA